MIPLRDILDLQRIVNHLEKQHKAKKPVSIQTLTSSTTTNIIHSRAFMKTILPIFLFVCILQNSYCDCDLPYPSKWIEQKNSILDNTLVIDLTNDRNIYFYYNISMAGEFVFLSHHTFACNGKELYLTTDDESVELFAYIGLPGPGKIDLYIVKNNQIQGIINFVSYSN